MNLVHILDLGANGALLLYFSEETEGSVKDGVRESPGRGDNEHGGGGEKDNLPPRGLSFMPCPPRDRSRRM